MTKEQEILEILKMFAGNLVNGHTKSGKPWTEQKHREALPLLVQVLKEEYGVSDGEKRFNEMAADMLMDQAQTEIREAKGVGGLGRYFPGWEVAERDEKVNDEIDKINYKDKYVFEDDGKTYYAKKVYDEKSGKNYYQIFDDFDKPVKIYGFEHHSRTGMFNILYNYIFPDWVKEETGGTDGVDGRVEGRPLSEVREESYYDYAKDDRKPYIVKIHNNHNDNYFYGVQYVTQADVGKGSYVYDGQKVEVVEKARIKPGVPKIIKNDDLDGLSDENSMKEFYASAREFDYKRNPMKDPDNPKNIEIFEERKNLFNAKEGIRVGDFIKFPSGKIRRASYLWENSVQPGEGSFYLGKGAMDMSGSMETPIPLDLLEDSGEKEKGHLWFFGEDWWQANNAVNYWMDFRVYKFKDDEKGRAYEESVNLKGIDGLSDDDEYKGFTIRKTKREGMPSSYKVINENGESYFSGSSEDEAKSWIDKRAGKSGSRQLFGLGMTEIYSEKQFKELIEKSIDNPDKYFRVQEWDGSVNPAKYYFLRNGKWYSTEHSGNMNYVWAKDKVSPLKYKKSQGYLYSEFDSSLDGLLGVDGTGENWFKKHFGTKKGKFSTGIGMRADDVNAAIRKLNRFLKPDKDYTVDDVKNWGDDSTKHSGIALMLNFTEEAWQNPKTQKILRATKALGGLADIGDYESDGLSDVEMPSMFPGIEAKQFAPASRIKKWYLKRYAPKDWDYDLVPDKNKKDFAEWVDKFNSGVDVAVKNMDREGRTLWEKMSGAGMFNGLSGLGADEDTEGSKRIIKYLLWRYRTKVDELELEVKDLGGFDLMDLGSKKQNRIAAINVELRPLYKFISELEELDANPPERQKMKEDFYSKLYTFDGLNGLSALPFPYAFDVDMSKAEDFVDDMKDILKWHEDYELQSGGLDYLTYAFSQKAWDKSEVQEVLADYEYSGDYDDN